MIPATYKASHDTALLVAAHGLWLIRLPERRAFRIV